MRAITLLLTLVLGACGITDPAMMASTQPATGCVSDPLQGDGIVGRCPPPNPTIAQQAAAAEASRFPPPQERLDGGCDCNDHECECILILRFGGGQMTVIDCWADENTVNCIATDEDG